MENQEASVTLVVDGEKFKCSMSLLTSSSDYFKNMFLKDYIEAQKDTIELKGVHGGPEIMAMILNYLETKDLKCEDYYTYLLLLMSSSMLQFTDLQKYCTGKIIMNLSVDNCLDTFRIASTTSREVADASLMLALWKFPEVVTRKTSSFWEQPIEIIKDFLNIHRGIYVGDKGEWAVVEAAIHWIQANLEERKQYTCQLLNVFDYSQLTVNDIGSLLFFDLVTECESAKILLNEIKRQKTNSVEKLAFVGKSIETFNESDNETLSFSDVNKITQNSSSLIKEVPRLPITNSIDVEKQVRELLCRTSRVTSLTPCVVGFKLESSFQPDDKCKNFFSTFIDVFVPVIYAFDIKKKCMTELFVIEKLRQDFMVCSGFQACAIGPSIYFLGGEHQLGRNLWNHDVWSYETLTSVWKIHESLPSKRRHHLSCVINDTIYLVGGTGRYRCQLNSIEALNTCSGLWTKCEDVIVPSLVGATICSFKGRLLVFTSKEILNYYPERNRWTKEVLKSSYGLGYQGAVQYKDFVYLLGSSSGLIFRCSPEDDPVIVECFGKFEHPTINICAVKNTLYSFTHIDGGRDKDHIVEIMDLDGKPKENFNVDEETLQGVQSETVWRENASGDKIFLASDIGSSFSYGCFPLFKM